MRAAHAARQAVTGEGPAKAAAAPAAEEKGKKKKKKKKGKAQDGEAAAAPAPVEEGTLVSTGKGSHATFYKMRVLSNSVMFVVDSSASMRKDDRIGTLKEELRKVIGGLPDKARANIVDFNCLVRFMTPSMIELNARTRPAVGKHIEGIETKFVTNTYETFQTVFRIIRGELGATVQTGKQKGVADTIYFLTDGKPTVPSRLRKAENARFMSPDNIVECVKFWNRRCRVTIHTIGIGDGKGTFLERLAAANNGKYVSH
jgi:hypothetical protein